MKKIILFILTAIIIAFPIFYLLGNISFSKPFNCQQSEKPIPLINKKIIQSFIAFHDNISVLSIKPATYTKTVRAKILFAIKDTRGNLIYTTEKNTIFIEDNKFYKLKIPKNNLSKNNLYFLEISYSQAPKTPIGFWATSENCYEGDLFLGKEKKENSDLLLIQKYSEDSFWANAKELLNRISQYKPLWLKGWKILALFFVYLSFIFLLVAIFIRKIF